MITGNKGEWSEIYVFLKLLAEGKLNAADANLNAIPGVYYPIIKILRQEAAEKREFVLNGNIEIIDGNTSKKVITVSVLDFIQKSQELFGYLKKATGRSFSFPTIESFINSIDVKSLAAVKTDKADIRVVVHDMNTGLKPTLGFSIKSMIGKDSTLFNPAAGTNFIFKILKPEGLILNFKKINTDTLLYSQQNKSSSKIALRLNELEDLNCKIVFQKIQSDNLELNLQLIDSQLPEILSHLIYCKFKNGKSKLTDLLEEIKFKNPLGFNISKGHPFYDYKIKNFLTESALGMTPESVWTGKYDATGGIIIVKDNGDLVCYHIYNKNEFEDYLINHTKLEQASTSEDDLNPGFAKNLSPKPYKYGWIYEENGELFIKLNLQIRFIK
ncbi:HpaII family restriction endonuclease [Flavobacterium aquariorum]|uniref:HpaII family restriction endonuclease n=1 Tax=Flavobacterium aquariorum TaxID=2217670 RepID=A0A2W7U1M8_9FLAO|nr:HpaII family restriction endonuclease [Flavobacterium aquariorum]PZX95050.1 HpaII family restriction endonuclease [Flavobacterium aquariorum]